MPVLTEPPSTGDVLKYEVKGKLRRTSWRRGWAPVAA
jgi:hypothetical protein